MRSPRAAVLLAALAVGCRNNDGKTPTVEAGKMCGAKVISGAAVGKLRLGVTADSAKLQCTLGSDTVVMGPEGMPQQMTIARYDDDSVSAEIVKGRIWRISVTSPAFHTNDSLRVGSRVHELPGYPDLRIGFGEGKFFVFIEKHCGLSFQVDTASVAAAMRADSRVSQLIKRLPVNAAVSRILVTGCS